MLRDKILGANDLPSRAVECPEWDCTLHVRALTAGEAETFAAEMQTEDLEHVMPRVLVRVVVDEHGERVFSDEDIQALSGKNAVVIRRLFDAYQDLNAFSKDAFEELEGNSGAAPGDASSSASLSVSA